MSDNFITPPESQKSAPKGPTARQVLEHVADALDELLAAKNIGSTISTWELRRSLAGYKDSHVITKARKEIAAFLAGK